MTESEGGRGLARGSSGKAMRERRAGSWKCARMADERSCGSVSTSPASDGRVGCTSGGRTQQRRARLGARWAKRARLPQRQRALHHLLACCAPRARATRVAGRRAAAAEGTNARASSWVPPHEGLDWRPGGRLSERHHLCNAHALVALRSHPLHPLTYAGAALFPSAPLYRRRIQPVLRISTPCANVGAAERRPERAALSVGA